MKRPSLPVFVVGMPKSGTTSIYEMFKCSGLKSQHYCCCGSTKDHFPCGKRKGIMGVTMFRNIRNNRSIMHGIEKDYDLYAQIDSEVTLKKKGSMMMSIPQHYHLDLLHNEFPNATFILNLRPAEDWAKSVGNWFQMKSRMRKTHKFYTGEVILKKKVVPFLIDYYNNHTLFIREFVKQYPSHQLIEINIKDTTNGEKLSDLFGHDVLDPSCWSHHNNRLQNVTMQFPIVDNDDDDDDDDNDDKLDDDIVVFDRVMKFSTSKNNNNNDDDDDDNVMWLSKQSWWMQQYYYSDVENYTAWSFENITAWPFENITLSNSFYVISSSSMNVTWSEFIPSYICFDIVIVIALYLIHIAHKRRKRASRVKRKNRLST